MVLDEFVSNRLPVYEEVSISRDSFPLRDYFRYSSVLNEIVNNSLQKKIYIHVANTQ